MNINKAVDKKFEKLSLREVLKQPIDSLQGVSSRQSNLIKEAFKITTIEQFSKLRFAKWAEALINLNKYEIKGDTNSNLNINKCVDKAYENKSISEILVSPVQCLQGLSDRQAELLYKAFKIKTVKQLGNLRFFKIAKAIYFLALCEDDSLDPNSKL